MKVEDTQRQIFLTPADFADTGQWRLVVHVSRTRMLAALSHVSDPARQGVMLFDRKWEDGLGTKELLEEIEQTVYDHPVLFDDYATEIIVEPRLCSFVPSELLEPSADGILGFWRGVFDDCADPEPMVDMVVGTRALFSLAPGFEGFMSRSMPGCRIRCHFGVLAANLSMAAHSGVGRINVLLNIREREADLVAVEGMHLKAAVSFAWSSPDDFKERLAQLVPQQGAGTASLHLFVNGPADETDWILEECQELCGASGEWPSCPYGEGFGLPLSAAMEIFRLPSEMSEEAASPTAAARGIDEG